MKLHKKKKFNLIKSATDNAVRKPNKKFKNKIILKTIYKNLVTLEFTVSNLMKPAELQ